MKKSPLEFQKEAFAEAKNLIKSMGCFVTKDLLEEVAMAIMTWSAIHDTQDTGEISKSLKSFVSKLTMPKRPIAGSEQSEYFINGNNLTVMNYCYHCEKKFLRVEDIVKVSSVRPSGKSGSNIIPGWFVSRDCSRCVLYFHRKCWLDVAGGRYMI